MEISVTLPLDQDGFIRRECPTCEQQFKWFNGQTADRPDDFLEPENYFCPYCGVPAGHGSWWTPQQLEFARGVAAGPIMDEVASQMQRAFKSASRGGGIRFETTKARSASIDPPFPLLESNDMMMVEPPCHPFEPLKIADEWLDPIHCLMCGDRFAL